MKQRALVQFGSAFVNPELFPVDMNRAGASAARGLKPAATLEYLPPGSAELRRVIALRYLDSGHIVGPDDIVITTGALEAIFLCLRAVTRSGDTVAIETPTFYATLQMLEWMGLRAAEIATDPHTGIDLDALKLAFASGSVKACVVIPTFQNPLGSCMPEEHKRALARLAERYRVPVIEDAAYAELYFGATRPRSGRMGAALRFSVQMPSPGLPHRLGGSRTIHARRLGKQNHEFAYHCARLPGGAGSLPEKGRLRAASASLAPGIV